MERQETHFPENASAITPDDDVVLPATTVYAGAAGVVTVEPYSGGNTAAFTVPTGGVVPVLVRRVLATGTTATLLVGIR
jgi:hypothetical protein